MQTEPTLSRAAEAYKTIVMKACAKMEDAANVPYLMEQVGKLTVEEARELARMVDADVRGAARNHQNALLQEVEPAAVFVAATALVILVELGAAIDAVTHTEKPQASMLQTTYHEALRRMSLDAARATLILPEGM